MKNNNLSGLQQLIDFFGLLPLPQEGGYYVQTYQASESLEKIALPERYEANRNLGTAILYLLHKEGDTFSALHLLKTDEIYHFYLGDPVELLLLYPDGSHQVIILGQDIFNNEHIQFVVPHGTWQGSRIKPGGNYSLLGTTMAPGFDQADFILGDRESLCKQYPEVEKLIQQLTRG
jgi:uncharacterized protein